MVWRCSEIALWSEWAGITNWSPCNAILPQVLYRDLDQPWHYQESDRQKALKIAERENVFHIFTGCCTQTCLQFLLAGSHSLVTGSTHVWKTKTNMQEISGLYLTRDSVSISSYSIMPEKKQYMYFFNYSITLFNNPNWIDNFFYLSPCSLILPKTPPPLF